jgi:hypothetical protein
LSPRSPRQRKYRTEDYRTPFEKLKSLPEVEKCLKPGPSLSAMERGAAAMSDTECARRMSGAKAKLLRQCKAQSPVPPRFR